MIKQAIISILEADEDVAGLVSTRIYCTIKPQGLQSASIVLQTVTETRWPTNTGATGLIESGLQIDCFGSSYTSAATLADYVRQALDCYAGTVGSQKIEVIYIENKSDSSGSVEPGAPEPHYRITLDASVHWQEN